MPEQQSSVLPPEAISTNTAKVLELAQNGADQKTASGLESPLQDVDVTLQTLLTIPSRSLEDTPPTGVETAAYKSTLQALAENSKGQLQMSESLRMKQEMTKVIADYLNRSTDTQSKEFIDTFNADHPGGLKDLEFCLIHTSGDQLVIIDETGGLSEVRVTDENASDFLKDLKGKDLELRGKSYDLRQEVLKRSNGAIRTHEAYTYAVDTPKGINLDPYLDDPTNWVNERNEFHDTIEEQEYIKALALSLRLEDPKQTVYTLRGNSGAGKTSTLKTDERFSKALDSSGEPSGAINPDTYKENIMEEEGVDGENTISHAQAHEESSLIARKLLKKVLDAKLSTVIDQRIDTVSEVFDIIGIAQQSGLAMKTLDIDASLERSALTVLGRKIGGGAPNVPYDAIGAGYKGIRESRALLLEDVRENPNVTDYVLFAPDVSGTLVKVAEKTNGGELIVIEGQENLFVEVTSPASPGDIDNVGSISIDDEYIESVMLTTPDKFKDKSRAVLEGNKGKTLKEALDLNASKINPDK